MDYLATNSDMAIYYYASDMILNIHLDASYLSESNVKSRAVGHFFQDWFPRSVEPIRLNDAIES